MTTKTKINLEKLRKWNKNTGQKANIGINTYIYE